MNRSDAVGPSAGPPGPAADRPEAPPLDMQPSLGPIPLDSRAAEDAHTGETLHSLPIAPGQAEENSAPHRLFAEPPATDLDLAGVDDRIVAVTSPACAMAEEYRSIRTGMLARWQNRRHLVHTITSATPQEGKTLTSLNLALIFSELRNRKVIVVEADLRMPQFSALLNLKPGPGLSEVLAGETDLASVVHHIGGNGLHVITAGRAVNEQAVQLLSSPEFASLIKSLRRSYDHVIIDTPPVVELADAGIIGALSDDVMLVARMNRTPRNLIQQAIRTLASYNAPIAGLIATDHQRAGGQHFRYGYRHQYRHESAYYRKAA